MSVDRYAKDGRGKYLSAMEVRSAKKIKSRPMIMSTLIEFGRPGILEVNVQTPKLVRVFRVRANEDGDVVIES